MPRKFHRIMKAKQKYKYNAFLVIFFELYTSGDIFQNLAAQHTKEPGHKTVSHECTKHGTETHEAFRITEAK